MNRTTLLPLLLLLASPALAHAPAPSAPSKPEASAPSAPSRPEVPAPTPEELKKVIRYYFSGKDQGPILVDFKACTKVDTGKDSPTKSECLETISGPVKKGTNVHAWTMWLVPEGGSYDDLSIQFIHEGQVRTTTDIPLTASLRSRTYRATTVTKTGKWEVKVLRGGKELARIPMIVQ